MKGEMHPLDKVVVFDALEVGPVALEPKRLVMPYAVCKGDDVQRTELIYSYDEPVFDPKEQASLNLAGMIGAQVALNYGLFAEKLVFHGCFDETDRSLLREMAENTAREIYVKKLLEPNPFLTEELGPIEAVPCERYCRAELVFSEDGKPGTVPLWSLWQTDRAKHAVLSSGGKDSLLSFGLLREMGYEAHPLYVNESGRHWFTALNAFRTMSAEIPETARVWTNSDRLFAWMLRQMPFIRKNFADMRSDEYPIRLWTVAVFLYGVLPLLRKRGIGRILIGDEYDTTVVTDHEGIPHYDGLFDQSRIFDETMSRYFLQKGWLVSQFSILRSLSEMLILKVLVTRYPELQRHQTSCHATHVVEQRVLPCGKCEKCRRIVGMLKAMRSPLPRPSAASTSARITVSSSSRR